MKKFLNSTFTIKNLRLEKYFLGLEIGRSYLILFVSQNKYVNAHWILQNQLLYHFYGV